ncbi:hypothetical protein EYF80_023218 [Liparis tanakae]|uniref:Uncharacterized protein n=1 Tax=Liparis tanakae TaxID=230148 RepID=A0A4Z2HP26_9TELE|nr:hypothetical protein EYF80_023218 [Liparis tanakae]
MKETKERVEEEIPRQTAFSRTLSDSEPAGVFPVVTLERTEPPPPQNDPSVGRNCRSIRAEDHKKTFDGLGSLSRQRRCLEARRPLRSLHLDRQRPPSHGKNNSYTSSVTKSSERCENAPSPPHTHIHKHTHTYENISEYSERAPGGPHAQVPTDRPCSAEKEAVVPPLGPPGSDSGWKVLPTDRV